MTEASGDLHKKTRRCRRGEGGRFGLRVSRLKHKTVIVCEVPHIRPLVAPISCAARTAGRRIRKLEQAMLALVIEYSKLMLLFVLIGTVVTLSRFESRKQSPLPSGDRSSYSL
jgi:hypothetical protein